MSESLLKLNKQICFALYSVSNAVTRSYRPFLEEIDLTYTQYILMLVLWEKDGISLKKLSEETLLDAGSLTPIVKRLEKKGLLIRKIDEKDERAKKICLTKEGHRLKEDAEEIPKKLRCMIDLPDNDLIKLKDYCEQITKQL
jgi:DNA-binding MarR family transcriptional regulator